MKIKNISNLNIKINHKNNAKKTKKFKEDFLLIRENYFYNTNNINNFSLNNKNINIEKIYKSIENKYKNFHCKHSENYVLINSEKNIDCSLKIFLKNNSVRIQISSKEDLKYKLRKKSEELKQKLKKIEINFHEFEFI